MQTPLFSSRHFPNRRQFLATSIALPFALRSLAQEVRNPKWVLLGTDKGKGIYRAAWNQATGELGTPVLAVEADRPTYFAMNPKHPILYSANEAAKGDGSVTSFRIEHATGELQTMQTVSTLGNSPCYVSVDQTGKSVFAANYGGGNVAAIGLKGDGALAPTASVYNCLNNVECGVTGPVIDRQDAPHMHCAVVSPDNHYVLACNLGEDAIEVFPIMPGTVSSEILGAPTRFAARSGSGPRHLGQNHCSVSKTWR